MDSLFYNMRTPWDLICFVSCVSSNYRKIPEIKRMPNKYLWNKWISKVVTVILPCIWDNLWKAPRTVSYPSSYIFSPRSIFSYAESLENLSSWGVSAECVRECVGCTISVIPFPDWVCWGPSCSHSESPCEKASTVLVPILILLPLNENLLFNLWVILEKYNVSISQFLCITKSQAVCGVAQSRTQLKRLSSSSSKSRALWGSTSELVNFLCYLLQLKKQVCYRIFFTSFFSGVFFKP